MCMTEFDKSNASCHVNVFWNIASTTSSKYVLCTRSCPPAVQMCVNSMQHSVCHNVFECKSSFFCINYSFNYVRQNSSWSPCELGPRQPIARELQLLKMNMKAQLACEWVPRNSIMYSSLNSMTQLLRLSVRMCARQGPRRLSVAAALCRLR